ncbi:MAG: hypothetical protein ACYCU0_10615, partial [Solirubrobacteraceae bacterium]
MRNPVGRRLPAAVSRGLSVAAIVALFGALAALPAAPASAASARMTASAPSVEVGTELPTYKLERLLSSA